MFLSVNGFSAFCNGLINIDSYRKMYIECRGIGSPAVILISGYRDRGDQSWKTIKSGKKSVFFEVSELTKVCLYDRPGTFAVKKNTLIPSRSDPVTQPVTARDQVDDLHALLKAAKIPGPYLLVAHSAGGLIARLYAGNYPQEWFQGWYF